MNENLEKNSEKLLLKQNSLENPINKEEARRLILNQQKIKEDHIFDNFISPVNQEETNDKSNFVFSHNYNNNKFNPTNNNLQDLHSSNFQLKLQPDNLNAAQIVDISPNSNQNNIISFNFKNKQAQSNNNDIGDKNIKNISNTKNSTCNINIYKINSNNLSVHQTNNDKVWKSISTLRDEDQKHFEAANNFTSNININNINKNNNFSYNTNNNIMLKTQMKIQVTKSNNLGNINQNKSSNGYNDNIISKIYKEDSFDSRKTIERIRSKKVPLHGGGSISSTVNSNANNYHNKAKEIYCTCYYINFREYFTSEILLNKKLQEIEELIIQSKVINKIKEMLNLKTENPSDEHNTIIELNNNEPCGSQANDKFSNNTNLKNIVKEKSIKNNYNNINNEINDSTSSISNTKDLSSITTNNIVFNVNASGKNKKLSARSSTLKKNIIQNNIATNNNINAATNNDGSESTVNFNASNNNVHYINPLRYKGFLFNQLKNPIGPLCETDKIYFMCKIKNSEEEIKNLSKNLNYWRLILGDGNCFYRAFLFALLELWILSYNITSFVKFFVDFYFILENEKNNPLLQNKKFNLLEICGVFYLILQNLRIKNSLTAYEIFLKAFEKYKNFDLGLIIYMRLVLYTYILKNKNAYYNAESHIEIGHLLPNEYIDESDNFLFGDFFEQFLLKMNSEAEKIIIYLSPIIFGVNLDLFILEGLAKSNINNSNRCNNPQNLNRNDINPDIQKINLNNNTSSEGFMEIEKEYAQKNKESQNISVNVGKNINSSNIYNKDFNENTNDRDKNSGIKVLRQLFPSYSINEELNAKNANNNNINNFNNLTNVNNCFHNKNNFSKSRNYNNNNENFNTFSDHNNINFSVLNPIKEKERENDDKEINNDYETNNIEELNENECDNVNGKDRNVSESLVCNREYEKIKENKNNTISLLYRSAHYDKVYTNTFIKNFSEFNFKQADTLINKESEDLFLERMLTLDCNDICEKCGKTAKKITFKHIADSGYSSCEICLVDSVKSIFKERMICFVKDNYNNLECN